MQTHLHQFCEFYILPNSCNNSLPFSNSNTEIWGIYFTFWDIFIATLESLTWNSFMYSSDATRTLYIILQDTRLFSMLLFYVYSSMINFFRFVYSQYFLSSEFWHTIWIYNSLWMSSFCLWFTSITFDFHKFKFWCR
jgi:hypothetical protein